MNDNPPTQAAWAFGAEEEPPTGNASWSDYFARARSLHDMQRRLTRFELRCEEAQRQGDATALDSLRRASFDCQHVPSFAPRPPRLRSHLGLIVSWDRTHLLLRVARSRLAPADRWLMVPRDEGE